MFLLHLSYALFSYLCFNCWFLKLFRAISVNEINGLSSAQVHQGQLSGKEETMWYMHVRLPVRLVVHDINLF